MVWLFSIMFVVLRKKNVLVGVKRAHFYGTDQKLFGQIYKHVCKRIATLTYKLTNVIQLASRPSFREINKIQSTLFLPFI